jgi:predicted RNA-binding Zn-ribbon protein involved in translation (DUF1610 family)
VKNLKGFWETLKQIKHRSPKPKFCPRCKGHNIYPKSNLGILPTTYTCRDCGYEGVLVLEIDLESDESG